MTIRPAGRALAGVTVAVALALPGAASAQTFRHSDPKHDVQRIVGSQVTDVPTNKKADVTDVAFSHTAQVVTGSAKVRRLDSTGSWTLVSAIKTPQRKFDLSVQRSGHKTVVVLSAPGGTAVTCSGLVTKIKKLKKIVAYSLPATCIGRPKWVKVGIGMAVPAGSSGVYGDDGLSTGDASAANLTLSQRLSKK